MKDTPTTVVDIPQVLMVRKNKLAITGFVLMVVGPLILLIAGQLQGQIGNFSEFVSNFIMWSAIIFPGVGAIISIVSLFLWNKTGNLGHALSIITLIMCNPFFFFIYYVMCAISSKTLAGLPWM